MNHRRSYKSQNGTRKIPERNPSGEEGIQRRLRGSRQRIQRVEAAVSPADPDQDEESDLFDLILRSCEAEDVGGVAGIVTDNGLDESDEDSASSCSSIVSGPSLLDPATLKKLCASCLMLYGNAASDETPIRDKLHDNDPLSLTCDQWVLLKKWTPRRGSNPKRKFLSQLQFDTHVEVEGWSGCSRLHPFLQRNLRCAMKSANKARGKKRTREDSQGLCSAKQQRLNGETSRQRNGVSHREVASSSRRRDGDGDGNGDGPAETDLSGETSFSSATLKTSQPKTARGFRHLLLQLRGNMIVRETQY